LFDIFFLVH